MLLDYLNTPKIIHAIETERQFYGGFFAFHGLQNHVVMRLELYVEISETDKCPEKNYNVTRKY
jgi:hypothetical protein